MSTYFAKKENSQHQWFVVDATNQVLGRLASQIAKYLRGKHKPEYTPNVDVGDYIIVINAEKIKVSGNKEKEKIYYSHSGYPGGIKEISLDKLRIKNPTRIIEIAVKGMLPKNPLGRACFKKLKVYTGNEHPHEAQNPQTIELVEGK